MYVYGKEGKNGGKAVLQQAGSAGGMVGKPKKEPGPDQKGVSSSSR